MPFQRNWILKHFVTDVTIYQGHPDPLESWANLENLIATNVTKFSFKCLCKWKWNSLYVTNLCALLQYEKKIKSLWSFWQIVIFSLLSWSRVFSNLLWILQNRIKYYGMNCAFWVQNMWYELWALITLK